MRVIRLLQGSSLAAGVGLIAAAGCQAQPTEAALRALEQSGRVSFVCLGDPADGSPVLPLKLCRNIRAEYACDYNSSEGGSGGTGGSGGDGGDGGAGGEGGGATTGANKIPHLYALVTQTYRGEIAVLDLTTSGGDYLIDQDPAVPGPSFLPVGGQPVGIVSTPGSTATFVTVGEVGREGIYAIPSARLLRSKSKSAITDCTVAEEGGQAAPDLSSWPACTLPATPGEPLLVDDPADALGLVRRTCDSLHEDPDAEITDGTGAHPEWRAIFHPNGDLREEGAGRQKLIVPLPSLGGIAVLDAQRVLDGYETPLPTGQTPPDAANLPPSEGVFAPCEIERWIPLDTEVQALPPPPPPTGLACVSPAPAPPGTASDKSIPAGLAFAENTLYVADLGLPLIHRLAMDSPCEPTSLPSLRPTALDEPDRVVTTSRIAVTPRPTANLERYLYATDVGAGTVMVFDVSDDADSLTPVVREHPEWTPTQPRDRLRFASAPRDLVIVSRDVPFDVPGTGVAPEGTFCNPDPDATLCATEDAVCDAGTLYLPASDFSSGAGPFKLRGTFAFVLLTNGQVAVVDIEDLDGPCRNPSHWDALSGCDFPTCTKSAPTCPANFTCPAFSGDEPEDAVHVCTQEVYVGGASSGEEKPFRGSNEYSCNVVTPNTVRAATYIFDDTSVGNNRPGIGAAPLLFDTTGSLLEASDPAAPVLRATLPADGGKPPTISINGIELEITTNGAPPEEKAHILAMNLENPRAHDANQEWFVTFEGPLPRFGNVSAELRTDGESPGIYDAGARFCEGGIQSRQALLERFQAEDPPGTPATEQASRATRLADRLQLVQTLPEQDNGYWDSAGECTFDLCTDTFGDGDTLLPSRDFPIAEAYEDRLLVDDPNGLLPVAKCCFPSFVSYFVRPGDQWIVSGGASGFFHDIVTDPTTGLCRRTCDPLKERMNGRVVRTPNDLRTTGIQDDAPTAFKNPMFRFAIFDGANTSPTLKDPNTPQRDMQFRFTTTGAFQPLSVILLRETRDIAPVGITFIPSTSELAVTDGALQGLLTISLADVDTARQFF